MDLQKIESVLRPLVEASGFTLYDLEMAGRILRVSIDKDDVGVTLTDCVEVSRLLNPVLDVEEVIPGGRYELEVSSPGLNRKLRRPEHFTNAIGEAIHVTTEKPLSTWNDGDTYFDNRKNVGGILVEFDGKILKLISQEGKPVEIPLEAVTKAAVEFQLVTTPKKGKKV